jgi:hypothetical protein
MKLIYSSKYLKVKDELKVFGVINIKVIINTENLFHTFIFMKHKYCVLNMVFEQALPP